MTEIQIQEHLDKKERWVVLSTIGPDGFPHSVPVGYFLFDGRIVIGCRDQTQKVRNIERNSKVSVLWENGRGKPALTGVMFQGHARVVRDPAERLTLRLEASRQRGETPPDSPPPAGAVYIEIIPSKTISWDRPSRKQQ